MEATALCVSSRHMRRSAVSRCQRCIRGTVIVEEESVLGERSLVCLNCGWRDGYGPDVDMTTPIRIGTHSTNGMSAWRMGDMQYRGTNTP